MGVLSMEFEKVNKTIEQNQKEVEKLQKQLERAKEEKENKKQYERDLHIATENDLKNYFYNYFEHEGLEKGMINLLLKTTRNKIIQDIGENEVEKNYIDNNYERILNKVKKVYENNKIAEDKIINLQFKEKLEQNNLIEIAKNLGYNENKVYTLQDINEIYERAKNIHEGINKEKEKQNNFRKETAMLENSKKYKSYLLDEKFDAIFMGIVSAIGICIPVILATIIPLIFFYFISHVIFLILLIFEIICLLIGFIYIIQCNINSIDYIKILNKVRNDYYRGEKIN